jgi:hypothetical protein
LVARFLAALRLAANLVTSFIDFAQKGPGKEKGREACHFVFFLSFLDFNFNFNFRLGLDLDFAVIVCRIPARIKVSK